MRTKRNGFRGRRWAGGVAAVEFVVAVPLLIFVLLAIAELGRAFVQYDTLSYNIRNSARFVSENAIDGATGVVDVSGVAAAAQRLAVYGTAGGGGQPVLPGFAVGHVRVLNAGNDFIEVSAAYPYQPLIGSALPMFSGGPEPTVFTMRISVIMRAIS